MTQNYAVASGYKGLLPGTGVAFPEIKLENDLYCIQCSG